MTQKYMRFSQEYFFSLVFICIVEIWSDLSFLGNSIFFFSFIFISWRLITLQYCSGFCHTAFFIVQLSHQYTTTGNTTALTRWTFVDKVMSLLFNSLVITFLPRSKCLVISWLQSPSAVSLEPPQNKVSYCFHRFPIYLP